MPQKILIVEEEQELIDQLRSPLEHEGYRVLVTRDGEEALRAVTDEVPDLVVLDSTLPGLDGAGFLKRLRRNPETSRLPVLVLSGKGEDVDKVIGLELTAEDFMTRPYNPLELVARVKALLRRSSMAPPARVLRAGEIEMDLDRYTVTVQGREIRLTSKEFELLRTLLEAKGRALRREFLMEKVWSYDRDADIESRTVDVHIRRLREKLGGEGRRILTVRNVGYRFHTAPEWIKFGSGS
ncbi:MAG TPA: response regulator transcription factor [Candidatus Polarisedimenticolia bacterium]|nr:response regulator transcription factor [Candidatus Polarisedimenticolia bacterium]